MQSTFRRLAAVALLGALAVSGCANRERNAAPTTTPGATAATFPVELTPPGGRSVTLAEQPSRIVSLNPTSTESLFAIGAGEQVVAVDDQSNFPADVPRSDLSGFQPNVEAIAGHNPDLVVASNDTAGLVEGLAKVKVPVLLLPAATKLDDVYTQISLLGKATGHGAQADALTRQMRDQIEKTVRDTPKPSKDLTYYHELDDKFFTSTSKTFIGQIYGQFGLHNIADSAGGTGDYPQLSAEKIVDSNPDLVFLADTKCCGQSAQSVGTRPGWSELAAVRKGDVVALDDDIASRWGPRVVDLVRTVSDAVTKAGKN
ncbi:MAG TPA: ABC transporter substrate-binding protein [Pseudonocardiaceae bacterium]|jgi:iron complex transport system substrate-binding protein|nr:ABC transporter substrate-binding protein [Pseudonocardiaceae bacterium]